MIILILAKLKLIHSQIINLIFLGAVWVAKRQKLIFVWTVDKINRADGSETKGVLALLDYHDRVAKAIWQLKYRAKEIGEILGRVAYARLIEDLAERRLWSGRTENFGDLAPLAPARTSAGFNQSACLRLRRGDKTLPY